MAQLKGGQAVIESLRAQGVDTIFGIISTHMMDIYDALYDHQEAIRFISTRHEHAAALMADGYARVTGKPGVCFTSSGPGAANSMGGMGEAFFASSPVLNITSTAEENLYGRGLGPVHETKDQLGMFTAVTQHNAHITHAEETPDRIYEAFQRFQTRRPQPIEIEVPVDIQGQVGEMEIPQLHQFSAPGADQALVDKAVEILLSGKRVGVLAGTGVNRSGANQELTRLAEAIGIPVFTTANGKGSIADDNPLSLGIFGGEQGFPDTKLEHPLRPFVNSLDVLLVVGSSLSEFRVHSQGLEQPPQLIQLDIDTESIGKWYDTTVSLIGDARTVLAQLNATIDGKPGHLETGFTREIREVKANISAYRQQTMPNETATMQAIRKVAERDAIFVGDVAVCVHRGANYCLESYGPRTYMTSAWGDWGSPFPRLRVLKPDFPTGRSYA